MNTTRSPLAPSRVLYTYTPPKKALVKEVLSYLSTPYARKIASFFLPTIIVCILSFVVPHAPTSVQASDDANPVVSAATLGRQSQDQPGQAPPSAFVSSPVEPSPFPSPTLGAQKQASTPTPIPTVIVQPQTAQDVAALEFTLPTQGTITQSFTSYHTAVDIANGSAPDVVAAEGGTVLFSGCIVGGYGCHIEIAHADGYQTLYGHLSRLYVSSGHSVVKGQAIGKMGATGRATGTHLHFELKKDGIPQNPLQFI